MSLSLPTLPALLCTLAAVLACENEPLAAPPARSDPPAAPAVVSHARAEIQAIVDAQFAAWSAKDADGFAAIYADDARFFDPIGNLVATRDGIRDLHAGLYQGPFAPSTATQIITETHFLTGTIGVVHLRAALTGFAGLPPGLVPTEPRVLRTTKTWVVVRRAGSWEIPIQHMAPVGPSA
jgi:uncharacterized protein (TIGR02246 family)